MITGKEHSSGPVVVLPFFWVPPPANVGREASFWKLVLQTLLKFILFISPVMLLNSNGRVNWDNVRFAIKPPVIVGLPYKACVSFSISPLTPFFIRDGYKHASTHFSLVLGTNTHRLINLTCHRWIAVQGMCAILHQPINLIFHS
ncbi:hypothetical protein TNCV_348121 [Trichonephila clavipes]|nr:hypothetical protein TNCV_348121 [Trichonephila clavipes]